MCDQKIQDPVMDKAHQKQMNQRKHQRYRKQPPGMYPPFQQAVASKYCHIVHKQIFKQEHICIKYIDLCLTPFLQTLSYLYCYYKTVQLYFLSKQVLQIPQIIPYFRQALFFSIYKKRFMCFLFKHINLFSRCINCCSSPRTLQAYLLLCFLIFYLRYYFLEFLRKSGILISIGCTVLSG